MEAEGGQMCVTKHLETTVEVEHIDRNEYSFEFDGIEDYEIILEILRAWIRCNAQLKWFSYNGRFKLRLFVYTDVKMLLETLEAFGGENGISWKLKFVSDCEDMAFLPCPGKSTL